MSDYEKWAENQFNTDTEQHQMTVTHDDGVYRHLRFQRPGFWLYHYEITTWPGHLTITGDMGTFTFARVDDMFTFFNEPRINPGYWAEKLRATDTMGGHIAFSEEKFRALVLGEVDAYIAHHKDRDALDGRWERLRRDVEHDVLSESYSEDAAMAAVRDFYDHSGSGRGFKFSEDLWDWDVTEYRFQFLWCLHAIRWGVQTYYAERRK